MDKPTLFDLLGDKVIWQVDFCPYCDQELDEAQEELVLKTYRGQFDHLIFLGYHSRCYVRHESMMEVLHGKKTTDC